MMTLVACSKGAKISVNLRDTCNTLLYSEACTLSGWRCSPNFVEARFWTSDVASFPKLLTAGDTVRSIHMGSVRNAVTGRQIDNYTSYKADWSKGLGISNRLQTLSARFLIRIDPGSHHGSRCESLISPRSLAHDGTRAHLT